MKKYNLVKLVLLAVICAGGVLHTQLAKANYNSAFNKEAYYAKLENKDIAKTSDLLLDTHKSLFLGKKKLENNLPNPSKILKNYCITCVQCV